MSNAETAGLKTGGYTRACSRIFDRPWVVVLAVLAAASCCAVACGKGSGKRVVLAAGPADTVAACVARDFVARLDERRPDLRATVLDTRGSIASLAALGEGRAVLAIANGDVLAQAVNGERVFRGRTVSARTIAALYTSRLYFMVSARSGVNALSGLRGRVVGVGPDGGGMAFTVRRVLEAAALDRGVTLEARPWADLAGGLDDGTLGAVAWLDGLPAPAVSAAVRRHGGMQFLNAGSTVPLLDRRYGQALYERAEIPASAYGTADTTDTVGVSTVLVAREDLDDAVAFDVTRTVFQSAWARAHACGATSALGVDTAARPQAAALHRGAARFYRQHASTRQTR